VTDSNCDIPPALCNKLDIHVVPLPFTWDGETYLDLVDMGSREFFTRLRASPTLPISSGPTPGSFMQLFDRLTHNGDTVLAILVGARYSSTFKAAQLAKNELPGRRIVLLDSDSNGLGLGFRVLAAARALRAGADLQGAIEVARVAGSRSGLLFAVSDLDYLRRGGRIALVQNLIGNLFRAAPIMEIRDGPIRVIERMRAVDRHMPRLVANVEKRLVHGRPYRLGVLHGDEPEKAHELMSALKLRFEPDELFLVELNPILGIHAGPGSIGIGYCSGL